MSLQAAIRIPWADRRPQKIPRLNELRYGRWPLPKDPLSLQLYHHGNRWAAYQLLSAGTWPPLPPSPSCPWMSHPNQYVNSTSLCSTKLRIQDMFFPTKNWCILGAVSVECLISGFSSRQLSNLRTSSIVLVGFSRHCSTHNNSSPEAHLTDLSEQNHKLSQINWHRNGKRNMSIFYSEKYVIFHGYVTLAVWRKGRTQASKSLKIKSWMSVVSSYAWKHLWISDLELTKWYHSAQ